MKQVMVLVALIAVVGLVAVGCKKQEPTPAVPGAPTDITKAAETTTTNAKDAAVDGAQSALDALSDKVTELKGKPAPTGISQDDWTKMLNAVDEKLTAANTKMADLKTSAADAWQKANTDFEKALTDLKKAYDDASAKITTK